MGERALAWVLVVAACGASATPAAIPVPVTAAVEPDSLPGFRLGETRIPAMPLLARPRSAGLDDAYAAFRRMLVLPEPSDAPAGEAEAIAWMTGPVFMWLGGLAREAHALGAAAEQIPEGNADERAIVLALSGLLQERLVTAMARMPAALSEGPRGRMVDRQESLRAARAAYTECATPTDSTAGTGHSAEQCAHPPTPRIAQVCAWRSLCRERLAVVERTLGPTEPSEPQEPAFELPDERLAGPSPGGPDECWAISTSRRTQPAPPAVDEDDGAPDLPPPTVAVVFDDDYTSAPLMASERRALRDLVRERLASTLSASVLPTAETDTLLASQLARSVGPRRCQAMPAFVDVLGAGHRNPWLAIVFGECQSSSGPCAVGVTFWTADFEGTPPGLPAALRAPVRGATVDAGAFRSAVGMLQPISLGGGGGGSIISTSYATSIEVWPHGAWAAVDPRLTFERARPAFRECAALSPLVWSDFVVDVRADGSVGEVIVEPIGELPDPRAQCVERTVARLRFARGSGTRRAMARVTFGPSRVTDRDQYYGRHVWGTDVRVQTRSIAADDPWVRRAPVTTWQQLRRVAAGCYSESYPPPERGVVALRWRVQVTSEGGTREASASIESSPDPARASALQRCVERELQRVAWPCTSSGGATASEASLCMFRD